MKIRLTIVFGLLLFPTVVLSQTHCLKSEIDYFSCATSSNGKVISICGNIVDGNLTEDSWVQYRFGHIGRIELIYPTNKAGSVSKFEGVYFRRYNVVSLRFINGKTLYDVDLSLGYQDENTQEHIQPSGGVGVALSKKKHTNINCTTIDIPKYFEAFSQLAPSLGPYNGKEDILYYFYNEVAK